jgi:Cu(I)/Ag(I) efflux system membrane fusion protein
MKRRHVVAGACLLAIAAAGTLNGMAPAVSTALMPHPANAGSAVPAPPAAARTPIYWQDPDGKADFSPTPKKTDDGLDYVAVFDDQTVDATPPVAVASVPVSKNRGKILYYRDAMGLGDKSSVPKKDGMGMDYVPVYENEAADAASGIVSVAPGRLQMLGVRTAPVESRTAPVRTIHASGTLKFDERTLSVAVSRTEGWAEALGVASSGEAVRKPWRRSILLVKFPALTHRASKPGGSALSPGAVSFR